MSACAAGKLQVLKFLLESAVYPPTRHEAESDDDSDADSGVLDPSGGNFRSRVVKSSEGVWCLLCVDGFMFRWWGSFGFALMSALKTYLVLKLLFYEQLLYKLKIHGLLKTSVFFLLVRTTHVS